MVAGVNVPTSTHTMPNLEWDWQRNWKNPTFSKYCSVYHKAAGGTIPSHINWDESSSVMETDIILKGFLQSEEQHGLRYAQFIGDGDSSIYPALVSGMPYGNFIKKWNVPTMQ